MPTTKTVKRSASTQTKPLTPERNTSVREPHCVYLVSMSSRTFPTARIATKDAFCRVRSKRALREQFRAAKDRSVWIAATSGALASLTRETPALAGDRRLLVLDEISDVTHHVYSAYFRYVVTASDSLRLLPFEELAEVLASPNRGELFIGGAYDKVGDAVLLYRGNVEPIVIPRTWFRNTHSSANIEVGALHIVDYGQTVRLGQLEASADAILYEFDAGYRRMAKKRALAEDPSLGASIRRLRLQKGLSRADFPGLTAKAIARVERNEVTKPHARTVAIIANVLNVPSNSITTY